MIRERWARHEAIQAIVDRAFERDLPVCADFDPQSLLDVLSRIDHHKHDHDELVDCPNDDELERMTSKVSTLLLFESGRIREIEKQRGLVSELAQDRDRAAAVLEPLRKTQSVRREPAARALLDAQNILRAAAQELRSLEWSRGALPQIRSTIACEPIEGRQEHRRLQEGA